MKELPETKSLKNQIINIFSFEGHMVICYQYSTVALWHRNAHIQYINKQGVSYSSETLFTETRDQILTAIYSLLIPILDFKRHCGRVSYVFRKHLQWATALSTDISGLATKHVNTHDKLYKRD